jgi:ubiquinone/menaquinone biosynthesis C-methylase UbiE
MSAQCLSVCGPCKEICQICLDSYNRYVEDQEERIVGEATRVLESRGVTIVPTNAQPRDVAKALSKYIVNHAERTGRGYSSVHEEIKTNIRIIDVIAERQKEEG